MARKKTGRPAGRPIKPSGPSNLIKPPQPGTPPQVVNWKKVDEYLESGASGLQIAAKMNMHHDTLYNCCQRDHNVQWTEYAHHKKLGGDADLHWLQMSSARRGNTQILLKLGELRLGQGKDEIKMSPLEDEVTTRHALMMALAKIDALEEKLNGNKSQAEQELCGSDSPV